MSSTHYIRVEREEKSVLIVETEEYSITPEGITFSIGAKQDFFPLMKDDEVIVVYPGGESLSHTVKEGCLE